VSFEYIQKTYGVPAKRGGRVLYKGKPGTIVSTQGPYIRIRLDDQAHVLNYHPTWKIEYLDDKGRVIYRDKSEESSLAADGC
jgi:hypothetical protein